ncbi:Pr6Pr family membrane protein [Agromyces sp. Root81]|uniref:Pr6Pr family membrane protein n=1 Tax=Agromyces sp. Root81 TaxID=1736601 RepID=UPI0012F77CF9|nr:Pr6Pr family membrane protein [Agromyces sp. Root81]
MPGSRRTSADEVPRVQLARRWLGVFRVLIAVLEVVALIGNFQYVLGFRFFATANFFSYFTVQSAFAAVVTLGIAAAFALLTPRDPVWLGVLRTMVTVYVLVSGIVFGIIVAQASTRDYRMEVPWSDTVLHFIVPALALIAWTVDSIMAVNPRVPWSTVGWVLVFPSIWLVYTLFRGADIGWYPYFFLDEAQVGGPVGVALYCLLVLVIFVSLTAGLVAINRMLWRRARAHRAPRPGTTDRRALRAESPALQR